MHPYSAGYNKDAALAAALERSRQETHQHSTSQHQSSHALQDDEDYARALQESLNLEHQDSALASSGNVRPPQVRRNCLPLLQDVRRLCTWNAENQIQSVLQ